MSQLDADNYSLRRFLCSPAGLHVGIIFLFVLSRFFYYKVADVQFDSTTLFYYWQFLDVKLLKYELLRSVWYLHQQPPLFNLFLGIILQAFPQEYTSAFQFIYLLMGLFFAISLFQLMLHMEVNKWVALGLTSIHTISPTTVIYEHWLFYTYPVAFLLALMALFLYRFVKGKRLFDGFIFFILFATTILTRQLFPMFLFCIAVVILFWAIKNNRKTVIRAAILPCCLLFVFGIKQYILFGDFGASSIYLGQNLAKRVLHEIPDDKYLHDKLKASADLPDWFFIKSFQPISTYAPLLKLPPPTGIKALDDEWKTGQFINFNHLAYLELSEGYLSGFIRITLQHPEYYLKSFWRPFRYFYPAGEERLSQHLNHSETIKSITRIYKLFCCGQIRDGETGWLLVIGFPFLFLFGILRICFLLRKRSPSQLPQLLTLIFIVGMIIVLTASTTLVSLGDFNRYRFKIDALYLTLLGVSLTKIGTLLFEKQLSEYKSRLL